MRYTVPKAGVYNFNFQAPMEKGQTLQLGKTEEEIYLIMEWPKWMFWKPKVYKKLVIPISDEAIKIEARRFI